MAITAVSVVGDCGDGNQAEDDSAGADKLIVDWRKGTYEGVRLGDSTARAIRVLGPPERRGRNEPGVPIGDEDIGGLLSGSPDIGRHLADFESLRYQGRVFGVTGGRVTDFGTTDDRAETPEGVGLADSRDLVRRRYRNADCFTQEAGSHGTDYPVCVVRVCKGRLLGFAEEPIKSIWLAAETKAGLTSCQRR